MNRKRILLLALPVLAACTNRLPDGVDEAPIQPEQTTAEPAVPFSTAQVSIAALEGQIGIVDKALAAGYEVDARDEEGRTALMYAAFNGHTQIAEKLLKAGAAVDAQDQIGSTALMFAASGPFPETTRLLLDHGAAIDMTDNNEHFTALMWAAAEGQIENVRLLLNNGADRTLKDIDGDTAESFAFKQGHTDVANALRQPEAAPNTNQPQD